MHRANQQFKYQNKARIGREMSGNQTSGSQAMRLEQDGMVYQTFQSSQKMLLNTALQRKSSEKTQMMNRVDLF